MTESHLRSVIWRKSSHSGNGENINCVEVAATASVIAVRDSKNPRGAVLLIDGTAWKALTSRIRQGCLDSAS